MREILWKYGIRFDVLENKQERAPWKKLKAPILILTISNKKESKPEKILFGE
jgi:hypothetical protein